MIRFRSLESWLVRLGVALVLVLSGCTHTSWMNEQRAAGYVAPRRLFLEVDVTDHVAQRNDDGQVAALVEALIDELRARGVDTTFADPESTKQYPRLKILVQSSYAPNKAVSYVAGPLAPGELVLECSLQPALAAAPTFSGRLSATNAFGNSTSDSHTGAESAARTIADAIAPES